MKGSATITLSDLFIYWIPVVITILFCPYIGSLVLYSLQGTLSRDMLYSIPMISVYAGTMIPITLLASVIEVIFINRYLHYKSNNLRLVIIVRDSIFVGGLVGMVMGILTFLAYVGGQPRNELKVFPLTGLITGSFFGLLFSFLAYWGSLKKCR